MLGSDAKGAVFFAPTYNGDSETQSPRYQDTTRRAILDTQVRIGTEFGKILQEGKLSIWQFFWAEGFFCRNEKPWYNNRTAVGSHRLHDW